MSDALIGWGSTLRLADAAGIITEIGEVTAITLPSPETAEIEVTHFKSPNKRREYISGLIEDGEGTFEINLVPGDATYDLIVDAQAAGTSRAYQIDFPRPGGGYRRASGELIVRRFRRTLEMDAAMKGELTVRFTGGYAEADV